MFADQITHALVSSGRFTTIERAEAFIDQVEREHVTQRSGAIDTNQIARLGRQAGAQFVCIARIATAYGGQQVSARIVNAETVVITHSGIATGELRNINDFRRLSQELVTSLFGTNQQAPPPPLPSHLNPNVRYELFTDPRDGKTYRIVAMPGGRTWMAENLNFVTSSGSWCYDEDESNCNIYGRLYDWNAARMACPAGWRLPDTSDFSALERAVGGSRTAGTKLKSASRWQPDSRAPRGTNNFGFSALPGGERLDEDFFLNIGEFGNWWSATEEEDDTSEAWNWGLVNSIEDTGFDWDEKTNGYSVRCVRN